MRQLRLDALMAAFTLVPDARSKILELPSVHHYLRRRFEKVPQVNVALNSAEPVEEGIRRGAECGKKRGWQGLGLTTSFLG